MKKSPEKTSRYRNLKKSALLFSALILSAAGSCGINFFLGRESNTAVIWTDRPDFAFYAEYFNAGQAEYKVEVRCFESPAQKLTEPEETPDIVAAGWLKSAATRSLFMPLDIIFEKDGLDKNSFYPRFLSLGNIDDKQYLLPVNFNIPAVVFAREYSQTSSNPFTIDMDEIKERGKEYNIETNGMYTRLGFSPLSNDEFLFTAAAIFGAGFREASPIAWESNALEEAVTWIKNWIRDANTGIQMEDDFVFKYLYDPPDKLVNSGRVLFIHMNSADFFILPEESRINLDFRWIAANEMISLDEGTMYYGIHKRTKAEKASRAFTAWFFSAETQKLLLEESKKFRFNETSFGIAGGFSAVRTVTEQIFPQFYPGLLGHMPPESSLAPSNILPRNWLEIKERVIIPYLRDRIRRETRDEVRSLERRISDWYRTAGN